MTNTTIKLDINTKVKPFRALIAAALQIGVIGIGVFVGSSAMQWSGFIVLILMMIGLTTQSAKKNDGLTIEQARKRLDELEAGGT